MAEGGNGGSENGRTEAVAVEADRGVAAIKSQFKTTKDAFHAFIDSGGKEPSEGAAEGKDSTEGSAEGKGAVEDAAGGEDAAEDSAEGEDATRGPEQQVDNDETSNIEDEPQAKKIKLDDSVGKRGDGNKQAEEDKQDKKRARGQNKSRPHMKYHQLEQQRLCPSIVQECASKCYFGDKCKFVHDIEKYLSGKPEDIGPKCYLYETLGKCIYGITCRFAKSHLGDGYKNLINEALVKEREGEAPVRNSLGKELQQQLRKKKFLFEKSEGYLRLLGKSRNNRNEERKAGKKAGGQAGCTYTSYEVHTKMSPEKDKPLGAITDEGIIKLRPCEKKTIDFRDKLYLAPLTTCGNLPFRRICKRYGADITCGEMAMCTNLLQGQPSEWALMKRHHTEDLFGVQLEGAFPDTMTKCAELLNKSIDVDFVDINVGCPIDLVYKKGGGCGLMTRTKKFEEIVRGMNLVLDVPLTVKIRTGVQEKVNLAHKLIPELRDWGVSLVTLHGRSREQRYTKLADWEYIKQCAEIAQPLPLYGNGDIFSYEDANRAMESGVSGIMVARGALVKPWLFTEIKEQRHWDISSSERFDILRDFTNYGLEHWGSDTQGVERTRKFMLEWLSFLCRYIPVGLLERLPQKLNERPPYYMGRDYLETIMASQNVGDWIKISEMFLGPVPPNFTFLPKHKANSYK
ncbi:tRNA-dihydrouridine(47) synthase [NAD(P)(+)]-like [Dendropsophus ebraccatus]|uniref:tRNA-dihydrouridine(47) synthase [NAD(P)(+)]-like n=1 Tax=Dendropsophus ebraccatus TaxID=150705 RepID=UPI0038320CFB